MEFQLKNVTSQPCTSTTTLTVGSTGTDFPSHLATEGNKRRVFYTVSGLVLASFADSALTRCRLGCADGPITLLKCSDAGDLLAIGDQLHGIVYDA